MGITVQAAYGSNKDISVYNGAGVRSDRILSVSSNKRKGCKHVDSYSTHLIDLNNGTVEFAQPADYMLVFHHNVSLSLNNQRSVMVPFKHCAGSVFAINYIPLCYNKAKFNY